MPSSRPNPLPSYSRLQNFAKKRRRRPQPRPQPATPVPEERSKNINSIVRKFRAASRSIRFRRRDDIYYSTVFHLANKQRFSAVESILERQKKYKNSMSEENFVVKLINLYSRAGMFGHARRVFDEMPLYGCHIGVATFNAMLYACVRCNRTSELGEVFREFPKKFGIKRNVVSCNIVLEGLCASEDVDSAMRFMEEMEENLIDPDVVCYNTVLEGYYRVNRVEDAEKLRQRMEAKGVVADARTYNAKLHSLIMNGQVQEAFELVDNMVNGEVKPDMHSYHLVITECVCIKNLGEAKILHSKMVGVGCLPDKSALEKLILFACDKCDDAQYAFELTKLAFEMEIYFQRRLMQVLVDAMMDKSMIEEANELVALVNSSSSRPYKLFL